MEFMGKIPPHSIEAEKAVIGAMMLDKDSIISALSIIKPDDMYREAHKNIFQAIIELFDRNEPTDVISIYDQLSKSGKSEEVGGLKYLGELSTSGMITSNTKHYSKIIKEKSSLRHIIKISSNAIESAYENQNSEELKNNAIESLMSIQLKKKSMAKLSSAVIEAYDDIEKDHSGNSDTIKSGFTDLDLLIGGVARGDMWLVAARPSMGKSAFALNVSDNASKKIVDQLGRKLVGAYFSFEMNKKKLAKRMAYSKASVSNNKVKAGRMEHSDWKDLALSCSELSNQNIYIDDNRSNTMIDIKSRCYEIKQKEGFLDFVIIDHIGLVKPNNPNVSRREQVSQISNDIKTLAMDLDCVTIPLSQLNRGVEQRDNKRPRLSDLKESGTLEEDADIITFLYRDEYYYPDSEKKGIAEVITAKSRDGKTGTVELCWISKYTRFENLEREFKE